MILDRFKLTDRVAIVTGAAVASQSHLPKRARMSSARREREADYSTR